MVIAVITSIVIHLAKLPIWQIWLGIIFGIGCAFWIVNQIDTWRARYKKGLTKLSDKDLEKTIRDWVDIPNLSFKRSDDSSTYFAYTLTDEQKRTIYVVRNRKSPQEITIGSAISIPTHPTQYRELSEEELVEILDNISLEMIRLGIYFTITGKGSEPRVINFFNPVLIDDSLTSYQFKKECLFVIRAYTLLLQVFKLAISDLPISDKKEVS